jgi:hypothetical protein
MALTKADKQELIELFAGLKPADCSGDIEAIVKLQATQTEQMATMTKNMDKVVLTVYGNGKPGLVTIVSGLVSSMGILKWVGVLVGASVFGLVWAIITHTVEIVAK